MLWSKMALLGIQPYAGIFLDKQHSRSSAVTLLFFKRLNAFVLATHEARDSAAALQRLCQF
jgi:hypothetical protein